MLILCVYLTSWPGILRGKDFNIGPCAQTCLPQFFTPAAHIGVSDFLEFYTTFSDNDLGWGSQDLQKAHLLAPFLCTLFPDQYKLQCDIKVVQVYLISMNFSVILK